MIDSNTVQTVAQVVAENSRLREQVDELANVVQVLAKLPVEDFDKQDNPDFILMAWNGYELNVGHVLAARTTLAKVSQP